MAVLRCTEAFSYSVDGTPRVVRPGDLVKSTDPAVKGREQWFEPVEVSAARTAGVEQATAAPGEKRTRAKAKQDTTESTPEA